MARNIDLLLIASRKTGINLRGGGVRSSNTNEPGNLPANGWIPGTNIHNSMPAVARKGRKGDTTLRNVDGQVSHVNSVEAKAIDTLGPMGEAWVKQIGSGTTNPKTGLKEYYYGEGKEDGDIGWSMDGTHGDASMTWKPSEGKFGWFGDTKKSKKRQREDEKEVRRQSTYNTARRKYKDRDMTQYQGNQNLYDDFVGNLETGAGEKIMSQADFDLYIDKYDPRQEQETLDKFGREQDIIGDQTASQMFGQLTQSQTAQGKAGFAGGGDFADQFAQNDIMREAQNKTASAAADRISGVQDLKDDYNQQFWEQMDAWDSAKAG